METHYTTYVVSFCYFMFCVFVSVSALFPFCHVVFSLFSQSSCSFLFLVMPVISLFFFYLIEIYLSLLELLV
jgi:hypothetical protein